MDADEACAITAKEEFANMPPIKRDLTGQRFGRLVALSYTPGQHKPHKNGLWKCVCDCGNVVSVYGGSLRAGDTKSCGCLRDEKVTQLNFIHGERNTAMYNIWHGIKNRCLNENNKQYKDYGGRGITICPDWEKDFVAFRDYILANLGSRPSPAHSIDRINNNRGYEPGNLRWATPAIQSNNRRSSRHGSPNP